jgi:dTDP-glucose pyrophosphorylase
MEEWRSVLVQSGDTIKVALDKIDKASTQLALVVDADGKLLGTLADGDIRRALLDGATLGEPINKYMCTTPTTIQHDEPRSEIIAKMRRHQVHQVPILDDNGVVVGLEVVDRYLLAPERENWIVIMAGGMGKRLKELTKNTPKPMLQVGGKPLLETTVNRFVDQGFRNIWLAVNYQADKIREHFGDGSSFGANIRYLTEEQPLGTAGALGLLPEKPTLPILVTNADILVTADYGDILQGHKDSGVTATMATRELDYQIPYGVVHVDSDRIIKGLDEKPVHQTLVNAGIYVLSSKALKSISSNSRLDMTDLFTRLLAQGERTGSYRLTGYWIDIGKSDDYDQANMDFRSIF